MATADKTTMWAFATRLTDLATNTTLGTATRHDFAAITIDMPETTRTIKSVVLRVTARDHFASAIDFDGWRLGIKLGAVAFDDVDYTTTLVNTGDHEMLVVQRDVTAYFVTNFGAGATQTCQVGVAFATGAASNVTNLTAELFITYDYDNSTATHVKSVEVPIQGEHTSISTSYVEVGTSGTSPAAVNQIPNLSTFLPEASATIKQAYLRVTAIDYVGAGTTDITATYKIDSGGSDAVRAAVGQALVTGVAYLDLFDLLIYGMSTNAVHAFFAKASAATSMENIAAVLVVTYTFTPSGTTRELHSCRVPFVQERGNHPPTAMGIASGDEERLVASLNIQEPGTITMLQSGAVISDTMAGVNAQTTVYFAPGQAARTHNHGNIARAGEHAIVRRCDFDSSNWTLARGINTLQLDARASTVTYDPPSGYALVNYTADVPSTGIGTGNRTNAYALASHQAESAAVIVSAEERVPNIPETVWLASGAFVEYGHRAIPGVAVLTIQAERQAGEDSGNGWYTSSVHAGNTAELWRHISVRPTIDWIRSASYRTQGMNLEVTRRWRAANGNAGGAFSATHWITHSGVSFTVAGSVTINGAPAPDGKAVKIYASDAAGQVELVASPTTSGGAGGFSALVPDNTRSYFASYDNDGNRGRSALGTPV